MRRLLHAISLTHDVERAKSFYRDALGLAVTIDTPFMANFSHEGAGLTLVAVQPERKREVELCFESPEIEETMRSLRLRGVEFIDDLRHLEFGSVIHFRDPEGHLLSLLRPPGGATPAIHTEPVRRSESRVSDGLGEEAEPRPALALIERAPSAAIRLAAAIVTGKDYVSLRGFYRDRLGLQVADDSPGWVRFHTGGVTLALRPRLTRGAAADPSGPVVFVMETDDLGEWAEEARARGVEFESAPTDRGFGLEAETVDPDGNTVVVREPAAEDSLEERLAEDFDDEGTPRRGAMRKPVKKVAHAVSRVAIRPEYKSETKKKRAAAVKARTPRKAKRVSSVRGGGPEGTRRIPKRLADPKRARTRPGAGLLKKAEARSAATKKRSVATASRAKPVKREVTRSAKARGRKGR